MKTKKPKLTKIQIFLDPDVHSILADLSLLDGVSVSTILRDLLSELRPGLQTTRDLLFAAHQLDADARQKLSESLTQHGEKLKTDVENSMGVIEEKIKAL